MLLAAIVSNDYFFGTTPTGIAPLCLSPAQSPGRRLTRPRNPPRRATEFQVLVRITYIPNQSVVRIIGFQLLPKVREGSLAKYAASIVREALPIVVGHMRQVRRNQHCLVKSRLVRSPISDRGQHVISKEDVSLGFGNHDVRPNARAELPRADALR